MRKLTMVRTVTVAVALGLASTAFATPKLYVKLIEGTSSSGPTDHQWSDCSGGVGRALSAFGYAVDSDGNMACSVEQYLTGRWKVNSGSCATAVQHKTMLQANFLSYCETAYVSWTKQVGCSKTLFTQATGTVGPCESRLLRAYSEGTN